MVIAFSNTIARKRWGCLPLWDGPAAQHFFEARLVPDPDEADVLLASVFQADPSLSRNEYDRAWLGIVLLVSQPDVSAACLDQQDLFLSVVFVPWYRYSGVNFLRKEQEMLRAVRLWADLQQEVSARG